tara:strand:+ start:30433 stop:30852 length:420 start_codon:yes stop_codon:yes gene_type:complete
MKVNKLAKEILGEDSYKIFEKAVGADGGITGKTTANVLECITLALRNPNQPVDFMPENANSICVLENTIEKLGLRFMKISRISNALTYELFEEDYDEVTKESVKQWLMFGLWNATKSNNAQMIDVYSKALQRLEATNDK